MPGFPRPVQRRPLGRERGTWGEGSGLRLRNGGKVSELLCLGSFIHSLESVSEGVGT